MLIFILLVCFLASHVETVESSNKNQPLGNTDLLRQFYMKVVKTVKNEGERLISNELSKNYTTEDENRSRDYLIRLIRRLELRNYYSEFPLCKYVQMFQDAQTALSVYSKLIPGTSSIFDATYKKVESQCPRTNPVFKDPDTDILRSTDIVLMLTYENGLGEFMRRSHSPQSYCCSFGEKSEGDSNRLQLHFTPYSNYGLGYARLWAQGHYLGNSDGKLNWNQTWRLNGQEWDIKYPCSHLGGRLSYCDLVSFSAFPSYPANRYLGRVYTVPNIKDGIFAVFGAGQVPY